MTKLSRRIALTEPALHLVPMDRTATPPCLISPTLLKLAVVAVAALSIGVAWLGMQPTAPDLSTIQSAYEREAQAGDQRHDKGLRIVTSDCVADQTGAYLCWIKFVST